MNKPKRCGEILKQLRLARGLSFRELGSLAGIDHAYIYRLEKGDQKRPSCMVIAALTKVLKPQHGMKDILQAWANQPDRIA
jgi:HTH-type transcriptional regulator, competence development regulator